MTSVTERLTALRNGLLTLHKALLDSERAHYERDIEKIATPGQFLDLVLNDPVFAWLRELSQLVVVIDETLDAEEQPTSIDAERLIAKTRSLLSASESGDGFSRRYYEAFQRDAAAVIAHGEMMKVLSGLKN